MDLHGSGLFRTGEKRSEGERRPAIVFLHDDCCRKQRSVPHLRFILWKKSSAGFFFFLPLLAKSSQRTGTQPPTHMRARKARTHQPAHVSRWIYRLRSCGLICKVVLNFTHSHLQVHTCMSFCTHPRTLKHSNTAHLWEIKKKQKTPNNTKNTTIHLINTDAENHFKCFLCASVFSAISHTAYKWGDSSNLKITCNISPQKIINAKRRLKFCTPAVWSRSKQQQIPLNEMLLRCYGELQLHEAPSARARRQSVSKLHGYSHHHVQPQEAYLWPRLINF